MDNKKIISAIIIVVLVTVMIIVTANSLRNRSNQESGSDDAYREELKRSASLLGLSASNKEDIEKYLSGDKDFRREKVKEHFAHAIVNQDTLSFFWYMDDLFNDSKDLDDNLNRARQYLNSVLSSEQAEQMLDLYKKYLTIQIDYHAPGKDRGIPKTPDEAIANLYKLHEDRRAIFGKKTADIIFGTSVKTGEYFIRRDALIADSNMTGLEKERKLSILNESMWGIDTAPFDENTMPYARYQERLQLYSKDLSELRTAEEKEALRLELQRQTLSPDQIQRLDDAGRELANEKKIADQYYAREKEILDDESITPETKEMKIRELQDVTFGEEADAFRRGEAIRKETGLLKK